MKIETGAIKFVIGWTVVFLFRLIPFRPPNVEPMLATLMPFSKRYGALPSFLFAFVGIMLYDVVTSGVGYWSWATAMCYGLVAIAAHYYFADREPTRMNFLAFGLAATLAYDAVTMFIAPIFNAQPLMVALMGQIPFTLMHLAGTAVFALTLSPALYKWVVQSDVLEFKVSIPKFQVLNR